jgi:hypothetical protein
MTELNVPVWVFFIIWMTFILGAAVGGWFVRGLWDSQNETPPPPPEDDDRDFGAKRGKW